MIFDHPKRWCVGIGPAFAAIGVGSRIDGGTVANRRIENELRALIRQMSTENVLWVRRAMPRRRAAQTRV